LPQTRTKNNHGRIRNEEKNSCGGSNERKVCLDIIREEKGLSMAILGRAIAQAVNRWLLTAAVRVRAPVWSSGICGGQSGAGAGFLRVLQFYLPIFIPPIAPQSSSHIIWGWYNRPIVAAVPSGLSLTPLRIIIKKIHGHIDVQKD
jgi:hypothetical protein